MVSVFRTNFSLYRSSYKKYNRQPFPYQSSGYTLRMRFISSFGKNPFKLFRLKRFETAGNFYSIPIIEKLISKLRTRLVKIFTASIFL